MYNKIQPSVLNMLRQFNICKPGSKKTRRGKRGGKKIIKPTLVIGLIVPLSNGSQIRVDKRTLRVNKNISRVNKRTLTYIDTSKCILQNSSLLKISYLNAQSARLKGSLLNDFIVESDSDLVFLTETWFRPEGDEVLINELKPPGFEKPISIPRQGRIGGSNPQTVLDQYNSFEACEFHVKSVSKVTKFIYIYIDLLLARKIN